MYINIVFLSLTLLFSVACLPRAESAISNTTRGFYVRSYYSSPDCRIESIKNFLSYTSGACIQNGNNGSLIFSCDMQQSPRIISYTTTDCSGLGLTHVAPVAGCTASEALFFKVACVSDLSTLFYGPGIGNIAYKNASECAAARTPVSLTISTEASKCLPMTDTASGYLTYMIACNNTSQQSLYCRDDDCRDCDVYAAVDLNQTCAITNTKEICVLGSPRPPPPPPTAAPAPIAAEPTAIPVVAPTLPPFSPPLRSNIPTPLSTGLQSFQPLFSSLAIIIFSIFGLLSLN